MSHCGPSMSMRLSIYPTPSLRLSHSFFSFVLWPLTMNKALSTFLENKITLDLPLKHPEVYCVVYTPEFPRPLVSTIVLLFSNMYWLYRQLKFDLLLVNPSYRTQQTSLLSNRLQVHMYFHLHLSLLISFQMHNILVHLRVKELLYSLNQAMMPPPNNLVSSIL